MGRKFLNKIDLRRRLNQKSAKKHDSKKCYNCGGPHIIRFCTTFLRLKVMERRRRVEELHLCINCLMPVLSNRQHNCESGPCHFCRDRNFENRFHNSLLCIMSERN